MTKHIETRKKLKSIVAKQDFIDILDRCLLTKNERFLMEKFYLDGMVLGDIALELGLTEWAMLKMHSRALKKVSEVI